MDTKLLMAGRPAVETRTVGLQVGWPDKSIAKGTASTGTDAGSGGEAGDLASPGGSGGGGKETKDSGVGPDFHDEFVIAVPDLPMASPPPSAGSSASSGSAASGESKTSASGSSDGGLTSPSGSESGGLDSHKDFTEELTGKGPKLVVAQTPVKASPSSDKLEIKDGAAAGTPATPGSARSGAGAHFARVCLLALAKSPVAVLWDHFDGLPMLTHLPSLFCCSAETKTSASGDKDLAVINSPVMENLSLISRSALEDRIREQQVNSCLSSS